MVDVSDELAMHKALEELERIQRKRIVKNIKLEVSDDGMRYRHGLGVAPVVVIAPLDNITVYQHQEPDAKYVYLKASGSGKVLLSLIG